VREATGRLDAVGGQVAASDGEVLLAVVPGAAEALDVALDLVHLAGGGGTVGLGWGEVLAEVGGLFGVEAARARRIAWRGPSGRVLCTDAFRAALQPVPAGIGLFRAGPDQAQRVGFTLHEIADHRR